MEKENTSPETENLCSRKDFLSGRESAISENIEKVSNALCNYIVRSGRFDGEHFLMGYVSVVKEFIDEKRVVRNEIERLELATTGVDRKLCDRA